MLPSLGLLRHQLDVMIDSQSQQGHAVAGLRERLALADDSCDALAALGEQIVSAPLRPDWPYMEPNALDDIWAECDPGRPLGRIGTIASDEATSKAEAAFLAAVCGCILGKPLEVRPSLGEIRAAVEAAGEWPLRDYISEAMLEALGRRHRSWHGTVRERIRYVAPDDNFNHAIAGWRPFCDEIRTGLANFCERPLSDVAARMGRLPHLISFKEDT